MIIIRKVFTNQYTPKYFVPILGTKLKMPFTPPDWMSICEIFIISHFQGMSQWDILKSKNFSYEFYYRNSSKFILDLKVEDFFLVNLNEGTDNSLIKAIYGHLEFARIHPMKDGNGREARTLENWILMDDLYLPTYILGRERRKYKKNK